MYDTYALYSHITNTQTHKKRRIHIPFDPSEMSNIRLIQKKNNKVNLFPKSTLGLLTIFGFDSAFFLITLYITRHNETDGKDR